LLLLLFAGYTGVARAYRAVWLQHHKWTEESVSEPTRRTRETWIPFNSAIESSTTSKQEVGFIVPIASCIHPDCLRFLQNQDCLTYDRLTDYNWL